MVVCLSHLGARLNEADEVDDERLIAATKDIDVVLGGHTHTFMEKPMLYRDAEGKEVPLLHSGKNGVYVGRIDLDVTQR